MCRSTVPRPFGQRLEGSLPLPQHGIQVVEVQALGQSRAGRALCRYLRVCSRAALIREREYGTMDHLLVMLLTGFEIAMAKVWANGLVIAVADEGDECAAVH